MVREEEHAARGMQVVDVPEDEHQEIIPKVYREEAQDSRKVSLRSAVIGAMFAALFAGTLTHAGGRWFSETFDAVPQQTSKDAVQDGITGLAAASASPLLGESLFAELSPAEVQMVAKFTAEKLGCSTRFETIEKCFLSGTEAVSLQLPKKSEALAYLDGSTGTPPPRMARVIVAHGDKPVEEGTGLYEVGPLKPDGGGLEEAASVHLAQSVHWNYRPLDMSDSSVLPPIDKAVKKLRELLLSSFGPIWYQFPDRFEPTTQGQAGFLTGANVFSSVHRRTSRVWFNWYLDPNEYQVNWLHPLPFGFDLVHSDDASAPPEDQRVENVTYCGQLFATPEVLLEAEAAGKVRHCTDLERTKYAWDVPGPDPTKKKVGGQEQRPDHEVAELRTLSRVPPTWQVTPRGSVHWRDWELVATLRPGSGLSLHDIRFRGERIIYELAMAEAQAFYSAPKAGKQFHYSDKAYSLVQISGDMVEGLDCPWGASFLQGALWVQGWSNASFTYDPALAKGVKLACVFESDGFEGSTWRHTQLLNRHVTGRKGKTLVVRAIGTVGNYDYITEVRFAEDGHVRVSEDFAGYPEMDRYFPTIGPTKAEEGRKLGVSWGADWGSTVNREGLQNDGQDGAGVQNLHAHYAAFKVDLDILGLENEFHVTKIGTSEEASDLPVKKTQKTSRVDAEDPDTEFVANPEAPKLWRILNPNHLNARTGTPRGYAIVIGSAPGVQRLPKDHPFSKASTFARRHLAVAQRKEEEPTAVHTLDYYALQEPLLSVEKFLSDRESLVGQDLVCWVGVGKEHVARAEDQPLVSNFGVYFSILPWDYMEENAAMVLPMKGKGPLEEVVSLSEQLP